MEVITTHTNADFDSLASMLAAKKLYPDAILVFPGSQEKSLRDFFLKSTFYFFDTEKIKNIPLKKIKRLILVDIRQASRIGKFSVLCKKPGVDIHIYDHHPASEDDISGSVEVIKPVGATATIMCQVLKQRGITITPDEATIMMLGIYEDTGSLTFVSTTNQDYEAASYLLSCGANLNTVSDMTTKELTAEQVLLLNELIENAYVKNFHGIEVMITKACTDSYVGDFAVLVHKLKEMKNLNVLIAIASMDDRVYMIARSRISEVNAGEIVSEFGGGGHPTAASATVGDMTLAQAEKKLLEVLNKHIRPVRLAKDFMASPVKTIQADETLEKAGELLTRYNINVLPVLKKGKLSGIISRQIIERASHHGLKQVPVGQFMTTEFTTVKPSTPFHLIQRYIIENNQRFLPVVEKGKIAGAITRTDLLRVMHLNSAEYNTGFNHHTTGTIQKRTTIRLMEERLPGKIISLLKKIGKISHQMGYNAYAVGGFVRDMLLGFTNYDIDIVIEGDGIAFARTFVKETACKMKVYKTFGTAVIFYDDATKIDIASARLEYYERPAAVPKVEWSSIKLDLYRRDFTINTLAIHLNPPFYGELIDFFGAKRDIKEKVIRVLHNLSFVEDPSRIFRAIRFEQRFGFRISKLTKNLIEHAVKQEFLKNLSRKRIFSEFRLILNEEHVPQIIKRLADFDLLEYLHPSIQYDSEMKSLLKNIKEVLSWFDLLFIKKKHERWIVFFLGVIDQLSLQDAKLLCRHFSLNKRTTECTLKAKSEGCEVLRRIAEKKQIKNSMIYQHLHVLPIEVSLFLMAKTSSRSVKKAFSFYFTHLQKPKIHVRGADLIEMGVPPGKIYKKIFSDVLKASLNGKVTNKDEQLHYIRRKYLRHNVSG